MRCDYREPCLLHVPCWVPYHQHAGCHLTVDIWRLGVGIWVMPCQRCRKRPITECAAVAEPNALCGEVYKFRKGGSAIRARR